MININFVGETHEITECVGILSQKMCFKQSSSGISVKISKRDKGGFKLKGRDGSYSICYGIIPDFCRALCFLTDYLNRGENTFIEEEDRLINKGGIMADVSRNAVLTVESCKDIISRIARMGMDTFMLYMEDTYKMENYPYFGYMRGAYTKEELKEIDRYAKIFGVEVVPCIQTLAHLGSTLRWQYADGMKDTSAVLLVDEPKTYEFIESMIKTMSECLSSKKIHIGMDEAWGLGTGVYRRKHGEVNKLEMVSRHLNKVVDILNKYGREPMIWGDMFFRLASKTGEYYDMNVDIPENIIELLPQNVTIAYWDYYSEDAEVYRSMVNAFSKMKRKLAFFGGAWTWNGISVSNSRTFKTTFPAIEPCHEAEIDEIYATLWGDDGAETSIYNSLMGIQLYAEAIYCKNISMERLERMFHICTGYEPDSFLALEMDNFPEVDDFIKREAPNVYEYAFLVSKHVLYQDILQGLFDKQYENINLKLHYKKVWDKLVECRVPGDLKELFDYNTQLAKVLYLKCDIGIRISENYKNKDRDALNENLQEVKDIGSEFAILYDMLSALWLKNNKAFGLDRLDLRFGGTLTRIRRAESRLNSYLTDKTDTIEELAEEKLPFSNSEFVYVNGYKNYDSVSIG